MSLIRAMSVAVAVLAGSLYPAAPAWAQAGRGKVKEGNRLYEEGRFAEAHQKYMEALGENPESPLIRFNAGNALYQSQDFQRAMEAYQEALESGDPGLMSAAWYNLGNTLYRGQQLEPSLEAYKQALRLNSSDVDAKHNLERVLEQMEQQEQEQQDQQEQDQQDQGEQDQGEGQPNQDQQDQEQEPQEGDTEQNEDQDQPQEAENPQDQQPREGEMTPEEARRLLDAIEEDPGDVNPKQAAVRGRKPKKIW